MAYTFMKCMNKINMKKKLPGVLLFVIIYFKFKGNTPFIN